ncbi:MAG: CDP-alcohol phosphatidyltransferase family protein [Pseudomonadota bacterium]
MSSELEQGTADTRRPIPSRGSAWAAWLTRALVRVGVSPNQVSAAGLVFALAAGVALGTVSLGDDPLRMSLLLAAPMLIGLRLLANMLDGLLAVEAGRGAPDGPLWNEMPDRLADVAVLVGAGYGAGTPELGWAAAAAALGTAHARSLGDAIGAPGCFCGPMGKPQRMAAIVAGALGSFFIGAGALAFALWLVVLGSAITIGLRIACVRRRLLSGGQAASPDR